MQSVSAVFAEGSTQRALGSDELVLGLQLHQKTNRRNAAVSSEPLTVFYGFRLLALSLIAAISIGCTHITPVNGGVGFAPRQSKIQNPVFLAITEDTKNHLTETNYMWDTYRVPTGKILDVNALNAFRSIFDNVTTKPSEEKPDRSISITLAPETDIDLGIFTFSENTFTTVLQCDIKSSDSQLVWSKTIRTESSGRRALEAYAQASGYQPIYAQDNARVAYPGAWVDAYTGALQDAANDSVAQALLELINEIYKARDLIFSRI